MIKLIKRFIRSETRTEVSSALRSTTLEPEREDPLGMEGTVVGYNIIIIIIVGICINDTLVVGAFMSAMTRPVHETVR